MKVRDLAFMECKKVLFKVFPMNGVMRYGKKENPNPRFIGPFKILKSVGEVAYKLAFPPSPSGVRPVFHILMLMKYHEDKLHVLHFHIVQHDEDLIMKRIR